ncbi:MAG: carbohydrate-binding module family 20 domain-containing protein, partial [Bacteroidales bacterium]|nr:carbohydrate-binding module family 20 domain-containing protein [Bacteroidales bacterium]
MQLQFNLHYNPSNGQRLAIRGIRSQPLAMDYRGDGYWQLHVEIQTTDRLDYTYIVQEANQIVREEWGKPHRVFLPAHDTIRCLFNDHWQDAPPTPWFYSQVFQNSLFRQDDAAEDFQPKAGQLLCSVFAPRVEANQYVGIVGSGTALGNWTTPIPMHAGTYPEWTVCLDSRQLGQNPEFQYVICD